MVKVEVVRLLLISLSQPSIGFIRTPLDIQHLDNGNTKQSSEFVQLLIEAGAQ
jgi:hypothetical protein